MTSTAKPLRRTFWRASSVIVILLLVAMIKAEGGSATVTYAEETTTFSNPERGWFYSMEPSWTSNQTGAPLIVERLRQLRLERDITLVRKYYVLTDYRDADLPNSYLRDQLENDFAACRQAGMKLIPRFTYTFNPEFGREDATLSRTLGHLKQIEPVLRSNDDVLDHVQAGFVGLWGEWHGSSNGHVAQESNRLTESGKEIISAILDATPKNRMVAWRQPSFFTQAYGTAPISPTEAYSLTDKARLGFHNDGVAYSATDFGTFDPQPEVRERQRQYWREVSEYNVASGEPAGDTESSRREILSELEYFHYSSLNINQHDPATDSLYQYLRESGAHRTITERLGYRFQLLQANVTDSTRQGEEFVVTMDMQNGGFARPYNPRLVEIVLRHQGTAEEHKIPMEGADPRLWLPGPRETKTLRVSETLPARLATGTYDVYLNMPDPEPSLYGDPAYSIRLANEETWEAQTGYNSLLTSVRVHGE